MNTKLAILSIGNLPVDEILPLLTENIAQHEITQISLLGGLSQEQIFAEYGPSNEVEEALLTILNDRELLTLSRTRIENSLNNIIPLLESQFYEVIMLMSMADFDGLQAQTATLLEPGRIIPPLVASIVEGHQVGIIVPNRALHQPQAKKWQILDIPPLFALANPITDDDEVLLEAGTQLVMSGAGVIVLDCLGYHQRHRNLLQKALNVPVLLSNVLVARLASELLA